jgi:hypothetical protein
MYHPPRCPTCDQELAQVWECEETTFHFNEAAGFYEASMGADFREAKCTNCKAHVTLLFEDGVYNYQAPKVEEKPNYQTLNHGVEKIGEAPAFP